MANANRAAGLIPVNYLNGARWNGQANIYYIPQSDTNAYAVGDPLATAVGSADLNGVSAVTLATAGTGQPVRGVLVGVGTGEGMMANPQNLNQIFVPATKTRPYYVMVVDDPNVIFEIQANDNHYGQADIGNNCNLLAGVNNGYTSGWQIDDSVASTGYTSAGQLRLLGTSRRLANVLGQSHCAFLVLLRTHELGSAGGGGGVSFSPNSRTIAAAGASAVSVTDVNIRGNAAAGAQTFNLPTSGLFNGQSFAVKKVDPSANTITLNGGGILVDGASTVVITSYPNSITIWYDSASNTYNIQ